MGVRVTFHLGAPDGLAGIFWGADLATFRTWAWQVGNEDPSAFPLDVLLRLDRIVRDGPISLVPDDHDDARLVDAVLDGFVGNYCDYGPKPRPLASLAAVPSCYVHWYQGVRDAVAARCSPQVTRSWDDLLRGRATGRAASPFPYTPSDPVFRVGFWTTEEVRTIDAELRSAWPAVARRPNGPTHLTPDAELAIEITLGATSRALAARTGLVSTVA